MSDMKNECREYAKHVAEEIESYYNEGGEEISMYDYVAEALDYEVILTETGRPDVTKLSRSSQNFQFFTGG